MGLVRRALAIAFAASLAFVARSAQASPSAKLVYVRGAGADACPGEAELRKAVATRIGYDPFFPAAQKTVIAQVTRTAAGYHGKVQIVGDDGKVRGERDLASKGDDCGEIVSTIALAVSIALDDLDEAAPAAAPPPAPPEPAVAAPPPPRPAAIEPPAPPPPPSPRSQVELGASVGPVVSTGTAPAASVGASLAATLGYGILGLRLDLRGELPSSGGIRPNGLVSTSTVLGALSGCLRGKVPFGCVGAGYGVMVSRTEGITRPASDSGALVVLVATGGADFALGRILYLEPFVEGALNLAPNRIEVDGSGVFSLPVVAGTLGLHLGGHFL